MAALKTLARLIMVETLQSPAQSGFALECDGWTYSADMQASLATQSAARLVSLAEFQRWLEYRFYSTDCLNNEWFARR